MQSSDSQKGLRAADAAKENTKERDETRIRKERLDLYYRKEEEDLVKILSERHGLPYINLLGISVTADALRLIPEKEARANGIAGFGIKGNKLLVAVISPDNLKAREILDDLTRKGYEVSPYMASHESLKKAWGIYADISLAEMTQAGVFDISSKDLGAFIGEAKTFGALKELLEKTATEKDVRKVSRFLEIVLGGAISLSASDIHIEPEEKKVRLRFRLDGMLADVINFPHAAYQKTISRIKLLSGMKLNVKESAQDGRFSIKIDAGDIEIRSSVLPGAYGESVVMRILNPQSIRVPFESLGMDPYFMKIIYREIAKPNGMILTTGPTGSGKTTTLYAILRKVYTPEVKIITIEDPIEYHLEGLSQTQVNNEKEYTFLNGLRAALRQDPDVIMVGEIRDSETAGVAINASLTGHLVISTLHTNNAAGVIPRLIDLGVNPKIISSAVTVALAQRLVRTLCKACKKESAPTAEEKETIDPILSAAKKKRPELSLTSETVWRPGENPSCAPCGGMGYKGRIGVHEGIIIDRTIEDLIMNGDPSEREIKKVAEGQNIFDMAEDGIVKILSGVTTLEEVSRVVGLSVKMAEIRELEKERRALESPPQSPETLS
ncbi:MAG: GspE/PulE family protein [Patescibacteria group bacterium]